jgi:hypothetical protein
MFRFPKFLIFFLAVVVSFVLYEQSLKQNWEYQALRKIDADCRAFGYNNSNCNYYFRERNFNKYGVSNETLVAKKNRKLLFYNVFVVCLIVQLFVIFAAVRMEGVFSVISMLPLFFYVSMTREGWLVPFYLLFIPGFAYLFSRLKKLIYNKIPGWFT